jgi:hypothetical protein
MFVFVNCGRGAVAFNVESVSYAVLMNAGAAAR